MLVLETRIFNICNTNIWRWTGLKIKPVLRVFLQTVNCCTSCVFLHIIISKVLLAQNYRSRASIVLQTAILFLSLLHRFVQWGQLWKACHKWPACLVEKEKAKEGRGNVKTWPRKGCLAFFFLSLSLMLSFTGKVQRLGIHLCETSQQSSWPRVGEKRREGWRGSSTQHWLGIRSWLCDIIGGCWWSTVNKERNAWKALCAAGQHDHNTANSCYYAALLQPSTLLICITTNSTAIHLWLI